MNSSSKLLVAGVAGAAVGAAAALLLAPAKGSETRKKLMDKINSAKSKLDTLAEEAGTAKNAVKSSAERFTSDKA